MPVVKPFVTNMTVASSGAMARKEQPEWMDIEAPLRKLNDGVLTLCNDNELACMEISVEGPRYHVAVVRDESDIFLLWSGMTVGNEWEPLGGNYYSKHTIITDLSVVLMAAVTFFHEGALDNSLSWVSDDGKVVTP